MIHNKHRLVRLRKNPHCASIFVPGPAANARRPREKPGEGGGRGAWCTPAAEDRLRLISRRTGLPRRWGARGRAHARPARTRSAPRACARRSRTAPPSSLLPLGGEAGPEEGGAKSSTGWGVRERKMPPAVVPLQPRGGMASTDLRESPKAEPQPRPGL